MKLSIRRICVLGVLLAARNLFAQQALPPTFAFVGGDQETNEIAFSPDGTILATVNGDGSLRFFNTATGESGLTFKTRESALYSPSFSADGKRIAFKSSLALYVLDTANGQNLLRLKKFPIDRPLLAPDGSRVAFGTSDRQGKKLIILDVASGKEIAVSPLAAPVVRSTFSPDGRTLAVVSGSILGKKNNVDLFDTDTGLVRRTLTHTGKPGLTTLAFSPDGKELITAGEEKRVRWDVATGKEIATLEKNKQNQTGGAESAAQYLSDTTVYITSGIDDGILLNLTTNTVDRAFKIQDRFAADSPRISGDGKLAAAIIGKRFVKLWQFPAGDGKHVLAAFGGKFASPLAAEKDDQNRLVVQGHEALVRHLHFSVSGDTLFSVGEDFTLRAFNVADGQQRYKITTDRAYTRTWPVGADGLLTSYGSLYSTATGAFRGKVDTRLDIIAAGASADGKLIYLIQQNYLETVIQTFDAATRTQLVTKTIKLEPGTSDLNAAANLVAIHHKKDKTVHLASLVGEAIAKIPVADLNALSLSPDGKLLAIALEKELLLIDTSNGKTLQRAARNFVRDIAWSADGKLLAVYDGIERTVFIITASDGASKELHKLPTNANPALAFSPDGKTLAISYLDRITLHPLNLAR